MSGQRLFWLVFPCICACSSQSAPRTAPAPARWDTPLAACHTIDERRDLDASLRDRQELVQAYAAVDAMLPLRVSAEVVSIEAANARIGAPMLRGEVVPIVLTATLEGPHQKDVESFSLSLSFTHDGTEFSNIARPPGERSAATRAPDVLRAMFGKNPSPPPPPRELRTTTELEQDGTARDYFHATDQAEHLSYEANCLAYGGKTTCEAIVPLGRTAASEGPELVTARAFFTLPDGKRECFLLDERTQVLPPGATLEERIRLFFADGPRLFNAPGP